MEKLIAVLAFGLMLSGLVHAGQYEDGWEAYDKGNYQQAYKLWQPLAEQGNAKAQVGLTLMYRLGKGVTQDYKQAVDWDRKAAVQGNAWAQYSLGDMYRKGKGVTQDNIRAHMWFNLAAANGYSGEMMTPSQIEEAQKLARECKKSNYKNCG